jgi:photosystem II stability/assembly factor-like uncharacterized protein
MTAKKLPVASCLLVLASVAGALGPWKQMDPYGSSGLFDFINLGDTVIASTRRGVIRVMPDSTWDKYSDSWNPDVVVSGLDYPKVCADGDTGYIYAVNGSIYRSVDHGRSWQQALAAPFLEGTADFRCNGNAFHVLSADGAFRAIKGRNKWEKIYDIHAPRINIAEDKIISLEGRTFLTRMGAQELLGKSDSDSAWTNYPNVALTAWQLAATRNDIFLLDNDKVFRFDITAKAWVVLDSALGPVQHIAANGDFFYALIKNEVWRTRDRGKEWTLAGFIRKVRLYEPWSISVSDAGCVIQATEGFYLVNPFQSQSRQMTPEFPNSAAAKLAARDGKLLAFDNNGIAGRSPDGGATWTPFEFREFRINTASANNHSFFAAIDADGLVQDAGLMRSDDDGATWKRVLNTPNNLFRSAACVYGDTVFHSDGIKLHHSFDNGDHWEADSEIAYAPTASRFRMLYTGHNLLLWDTSHVFLSTNMGRTWSDTASLVQTAYSYLDRIEVVNTGKHLFMGMGQNLFASADEGKHWEQLKAPGQGITGMTGNADFLMVANDSDGVLISRDEGVSWTPHNFGRPWGANMLACDGKRAYAISKWGLVYSAELDAPAPESTRKKSLGTFRAQGNMQVNALGRGGRGLLGKLFLWRGL